MAQRTSKSLEQWEKEVDGILLDIRKHFIRLGEVLFFAHQDLKAEEYDRLVKHINKWDFIDADLRAARAAFLYEHPELGKADNGDDREERIAPALLFAGAKNSKILSLDKEDQERLLSGEKFQTVMANGKVDQAKSWAELSEQQRNMLISKKGGRILTVSEQQQSLSGNKKNAALHLLGSIELHKEKVICTARTSKDSNFTLQCSLTEFAKMILLDDGFWEELTSAVEDAQQELGKKNASRSLTGR